MPGPMRNEGRDMPKCSIKFHSVLSEAKPDDHESAATDICPNPSQRTAVNVTDEIIESKTQVRATWFYGIKNTECQICSADMSEILAKAWISR